AGTVWALGGHFRANGEARVRWDPLGDRGPDTNFSPFFKNPSSATLSHTRPDSRLDATVSLVLGRNQELRAGATWIRGIPEARATFLVLY
ncbi:MAG TPA: hypothetical protein VMV18_07660, partial [bacterium]|nr:hypothetical protein [bacterium]